MLDDFSLPELVNLAKQIREHKGDKGLIDYTAQTSWCGCMGPSRGERLCPCTQRSTLESNMVEIVAQFDEELAKRIWLARFVKSLPG